MVTRRFKAGLTRLSIASRPEPPRRPGETTVPAGGTIGVVWVGPETLSPELLAKLGEQGLPCLQVATVDEVWEALVPLPILCFGDGAEAMGVAALLDGLAAESPPRPAVSLVLSAGADPARFQPLIDDDRLFFLARGLPAERDLLSLIESAAGTLRRRSGSVGQADDPASVADPGFEVEFLRQLAQARDPSEVAEILASQAVRALASDRARCLLYDPAREILWSAAEADEERAESPAVGLVSFVLRTGVAVCLPQLGDDPRFDREADDPGGSPTDRFLAVPVLGVTRSPLAVLVVLRPAGKPPFEPAEVARLKAIARIAAPFLVTDGADGGSTGPFRREALRELELASPGQQEPLRLAPSWIGWTHGLVVSLLLTAGLASVFVRVPEYASGPAIVRLGGRTEVTAAASGVVSSLAVEPGQAVQAGRLLVALRDEQEAASLARLERAFELKLVQRLQAPGDPRVAEDLLTLRADRDLAAVQVAQREIRAPVSGIVSDLRVRRGQSLSPGQPMLSLVEGAAAPSLVALIPGQYLPQLRRGMRVRFELGGYPYLYQWLTLDGVASEVLGPTEARRLLGPATSDSIDLPGAVAVITARLPAPTFELAGESYAFRDGMPGRAEVQVRSERLLLTLIPALRGLLAGGHD